MDWKGMKTAKERSIETSLQQDWRVATTGGILRGCFCLEWYPVLRGSVRLTIGGVQSRDDGEGRLVDRDGRQIGTVGYSNGEVILEDTDSTDYSIKYAFDPPNTPQSKWMHTELEL